MNPSVVGDANAVLPSLHHLKAMLLRVKVMNREGLIDNSDSAVDDVLLTWVHKYRENPVQTFEQMFVCLRCCARRSLLLFPQDEGRAPPQSRNVRYTLTF